ncbi:hypothetical protein ACS0TY_010667 [Phlomoides rotata]
MFCLCLSLIWNFLLPLLVFYNYRVVCLCCFFAYVFKFSVIGLEPFKSVKVQYGDDVRLSMPYVLPLPLLFFWISNMQQDHANKESRCILKN